MHLAAIEAGGAVETRRPGLHRPVEDAAEERENKIPDVFIRRLLLNPCEVWLGVSDPL